jgi:hypothetical protein
MLALRDPLEEGATDLLPQPLPSLLLPPHLVVRVSSGAQVLGGFLPALIALGGAQGQHRIDVVGSPMHASPFEPRLHHHFVSTFYDAGADGPAVLLILRILHTLFPHAAQAVSSIGQEAGVQELTCWLTTQLHELKHHGPAAVLAEVSRLCVTLPLNESMRQQYGYLLKREERMQYPQYQQDGWPIGSGIVESGNKVVMQARLKGAGMHWAPAHVNPMLALRTAACNDRWQEAQQQLRTWRHAQRHGRREEQARQHLRQQVCRTLLKRVAQREYEAPPPATSSPSPVKRLPKYSWRQPFLPRPVGTKT